MTASLPRNVGVANDDDVDETIQSEALLGVRPALLNAYALPHNGLVG
jgi:hypothetical protein